MSTPLCNMPASRAALLYGGIVCLLYALVPSLFFPGPPLDVVEGFAWGRELQLGYTKHPPMQAWLLEATYQLTGGYAGGYWLSALCAGIGYVFVWQIGKRLGFSDWQAFWAVVLTSVTFYFTLPMPEFNPNILQIPVWTGMILLFHRALQKGHLLDWMLLGALAAFGFYVKYFVLLLVGTIGLYSLVFKDARHHLLTPGPWLCAITCLILLVPHGFWLLETDFLTFQYAASRSKPAMLFWDHIFNPLNFLGAQIGNHAGLLVVVLAGLGFHGLTHFLSKVEETSNERDRRHDRFLLWFGFVPLTVVLLTSALSGNEFEHMWGTPMFVLSGVLAVRYLALPAAWPHPKRALWSAGFIQFVFLTVLFGQAVLEPHWKTKQSRMHYPAKAVALELAAIWQEETGSNLAYVAGDMWSAANVTLFAPERPSMFYLHDQVLSPWIDIDDIQKKGLMIVWRGERDKPLNEILHHYPNAVRHGQRTFPYQTSGPMPDARINWIIIPPGAVSEAMPK
ncbi:glycosyltransferase family 39 protein [Roseibium porphyridii]|uniref:Glycosyltransferase family 39 protein n=1 Tax=Roseibium porphyridii TaxID=2866279 RepID=A0ABY8F4Z2_9HYPH|nr:glycosyltransferase family 39 protein [Roseibium sp. KMA01]WFE90562.1 glycosyltransferase family 39 protein [Roseibium sp. KMA01]